MKRKFAAILLGLVIIICMLGWLLLLSMTEFNAIVVAVGLLLVLSLSAGPPAEHT